MREAARSKVRHSSTAVLGDELLTSRVYVKNRILYAFWALLGAGMFALGGWAKGEFWLMVAGSAGMIFGPVGVYVLQSGVRVTLCMNGVRRVDFFGDRSVTWARLAAYTLKITDDRDAAYERLGPLLDKAVAFTVRRLMREADELQPHALVLTPTHGGAMELPASLEHFGTLVEVIVPILHERLYPTLKERFDGDTLLAFGKHIRLQRSVGLVFAVGMGKPDAPLALRDLKRVQTEGDNLAFYKRRHREPWRRIPISTIPNVGVLQRLLSVANRAGA